MPRDALPLWPKIEEEAWLRAIIMTVKSKNLRWKVAQEAEIRWWQSYLRQRPKKVYLAWKENYWLEFLQKCQYFPGDGERVLDAGCGPAGIFMVLKEQQVDALDPLLDQYAQKLEHFSPADYPWVQFQAKALEDLAPTKPYDTVFCLNAINHVSDLEWCFDQLAAVTKSGGTLLVSIDAHNYPLLKRLFRWLPGDILHPHQYDLAEYQTMLTQRGFEIEQRILLKEELIFDYHVLVARKK